MARGGSSEQAERGQQNLLHGPRRLPPEGVGLAARSARRAKFYDACTRLVEAGSHTEFDQILLEALTQLSARPADLEELVDQARFKVGADQLGFDTIINQLRLAPKAAIDNYAHQALAALREAGEAVASRRQSPERALQAAQERRKQALSEAVDDLRHSLGQLIGQSFASRLLGAEQEMQLARELDAHDRHWNDVVQLPERLVDDLRDQIMADPAGACKLLKRELEARVKSATI